MIVVAPGVVLDTPRPRSGGFPRHSHDEYVISANLLGRESVRLDAATFEVGTREVTVYNPGQVQSSTTATPSGAGWACVSLYVSAARAAAWSEASHLEASRPVVVDPVLRDRLLSAAALAQTADEDEEDRQLLAEGLEVLFGQVMAATGSRPTTAAAATAASAGPGDSPSPARSGGSWIDQVREQLADDLTTPVGLEDLARQVGYSREHLIRAFTAAHGCPPYAWQLGARLARARSQLARGMEVAQVAHAVGFADQAHLSKHFVAAYATTPGRWRRAHLQ